MKSLVRLGAILGIAGTTLLGSLPIANTAALAIPQPQILEKLRPVPVFTITDASGAPLIASVPKQGQGQTGNASVAGIFISQKDAQAFVEQLKTRNPQLAASVRVMPVSLGEIYQITESNKDKPNEVQFAYVPAPSQVQSAKTVLQQTGQQVNEFNGVPLFLARGGPDNGYLTIQRGQQEVIPLFFNKEELQTMVERFKQVAAGVVGEQAILERAQRLDREARRLPDRHLRLQPHRSLVAAGGVSLPACVGSRPWRRARRDSRGCCAASCGAALPRRAPPGRRRARRCGRGDHAAGERRDDELKV